MEALRKFPKLISDRFSKASPNILSSTSSSSSDVLISRCGIITKLFVGGLSFYTTENGLIEDFSQHGQVIEAKIVTDRVSDKPKGFGFVTFASEDEAEKATREMNEKQLDGHVIYVDHAKPRTNFRSEMPIARGPPESVKDGWFQTVVGDLATQGERLQSLLSWRDPRATSLFVVFCLVAAIVLYVTPFQVLALFTGFYVLRHPRFSHKLPSAPLNFFRRLPLRTDCML